MTSTCSITCNHRGGRYFYVVDHGYVDFTPVPFIQTGKAIFVTRAKRNLDCTATGPRRPVIKPPALRGERGRFLASIERRNSIRCRCGASRSRREAPAATRVPHQQLRPAGIDDRPTLYKQSLAGRTFSSNGSSRTFASRTLQSTSENAVKSQVWMCDQHVRAGRHREERTEERCAA